MTSQTSSLAVSQQCGLRSKHFARREIFPARRGLMRPTCCCCALDGNARRVGFSAQTLPEAKALRKDSKMTLDNSKPCRLTDYDWEIGVNIGRIFT
jgi:hypothetical protein